MRDGQRVIAPEQENGVTTSEAMGYGMLIAAAMGDQATFDGFWSYVQANLEGTGLMNWKPSGGSGSATDGDNDIAYALLMADAQWGGYASAASAMISAILANDVDGSFLKPGSGWSDRFNPSYFAPSYYRVFSGFDSVISGSYTLLNNNISATTAGFPSNWADPQSGNPTDAGSAAVTSDLVEPVYGYDAARVPWRIGLDVCSGGTEGSSAVNSIVSYFAPRYDDGATIDLLKAGWDKNTGGVAPEARPMQGSFIGPMGIAGMAVGNTAMRDRAFRTMLDILENGDFNHTYFPSTVGFITMLIMSGNFPMP